MTKISALPTSSSTSLSDYFPLYSVANGDTEKALISDMIALVSAQVVPVGMAVDYAGYTAPTGWLMCYGQAISRSTYAALYAIIAPTIGTFTVTIATPAVVTLASHGLQTGDAVFLTTTGALPTGLSANTIYYAVRIDASTFNLSTSRANAYAGTKINTSGTQSGTHTLQECAYGLGDGSTTFNVPDFRGRVTAGNDSMGATAASRLTLAQSQGVYGNLGATGGEQGHTTTIAELAAHTHTGPNRGGITYAGGGSAQAFDRSVADASIATDSTGSGTAHNNVQPSQVVNKIIKT